MGRLLDDMIMVRMRKADVRRAIRLAMKIDEASLSGLLRDVVTKGMLAPPKERVKFFEWLAVKLDSLEERQMLIEQVRAAQTQQAPATGPGPAEGRRTRGAV